MIFSSINVFTQSQDDNLFSATIFFRGSNMGYWDYKPWDNDEGADWFIEFMDKTQLCKFVESSLNADVKENAATVRAAASVLIMLGRNYVWDVETIDQHLTLAIQKLQEILDVSDLGEDENIRKSIEYEIKVLKGRFPEAELSYSLDELNWWVDWI